MLYRNVIALVTIAVVISSGYLVSTLHTDTLPRTETSDIYVSTIEEFDSELIQPIPYEARLSVDAIDLGERLFNDPRLSHDNTIACSSCHDLNKGGTDRAAHSIGINGAKGSVNAPTVFNSSFNMAQFWDGRAQTLEEQAAGPIHNPLEMNSNWSEVLEKLQSDDEYLVAFGQLYPDGITPTNIVGAIATFERALITPNSRFDLYLRGVQDSLTTDELEGYRRFKEYGCVSCHQGINIGGNMFQRFGVMGGYFEGRKLVESDLGRFNVTGLEEDRYVFKVPSLRNVAVTYPYLHDGSAETLKSVILTMGRYQLGRQLSDEDVRLISLFLHTLTGQWNGVTLQ